MIEKLKDVSERFDRIEEELSDPAVAADQERYRVIFRGLKSADECIKCGSCEEACPQHLPIREELERALELIH